MYIDTCKTTVRGKTYTRHLLRRNYRENGKVKHENLANLSKVPDDTIKIIKAGLKGELVEKIPADQVVLKQGPSFGSVFTLASISKQLQISKVLEKSPLQKEILWLIFARIIDQGSRLSASRLSEQHAVKEVLGLENTQLHRLYAALDWAADHQEEIEKKLFTFHSKQDTRNLFLYDVTSSYLEGKDNDYAQWGYNRDKKKGKKQIVIGLLTDADGDPVSVRVFDGNTKDPVTCLDQIRDLAESFCIKEVTLVGDRGMIKNPQIKSIQEQDFHFITAITKPQIESLIKKEVFQLDLFETELVEVFDKDIRYILRRNPWRAKEIAVNREAKSDSIKKRVDKANQYLSEHRKASPDIQLRDLKKYTDKLKVSSWVILKIVDGQIEMSKDKDKLIEISRLDGSYAIKTDLLTKDLSKESIHQRYKDLIKVENAFRTMKTECLEVRPVYVRNARRTRGHVFLTMLAYRIIREIENRIPEYRDIPIQETINILSQIGLVEMTMGDQSIFRIPDVSLNTQKLLDALNISIPKIIPREGMEVL